MIRWERPEKRGETSKTFENIDGTYTLEAHCAPIHYKENYLDNREPWKDIDLNHTVETSEYIEYDRLPSIVRIFKNKTGYEMISRRTGHKFVVELNSLDNKKVSKNVDDDDLEFQFEVLPFRVRLWKHLKTDKSPKEFKWKITEENNPKRDKKQKGDLYFREDTEASEILDEAKKIEIEKLKEIIDDKSFYWTEKAPKTGIKIDTDVSYYSGAGDGGVGCNQSTWDDAHDASVGGYVRNLAYQSIGSYYSSPIFVIRRAFFPIDTSGLPDGANIDSAILYLTCDYYDSNNSYGNKTFSLVQTNQASTSTLTTDDFDQCGAINNPTEGSSRVTIDSVGEKTFSLNPTGLSWISKTGYTKLGVRSGYDCDDEAVVDGSKEVHIFVITSENSGTSQDPRLDITYTINTETSSRDAKTTGKETAFSVRTAKITGAIADTYQKEFAAVLPTDGSSLAVNYTSQEVTDVSASDDDRVPLEGTDTGFFVHQFSKVGEDNTTPISIEIELQSTLAPSASTVYLQIYNRTAEEWETIDSESSASANTDFILEATVSSDLSDYYDANFIVLVRVYQGVS